MITLKTDQGFEVFESWDDIQSRPGFEPNLDPSQHELKEIIGRYAFSDAVKCGLSCCHTPHNYGYVVVTKTGRSTNIGQVCGRTYFGVEFQKMSRILDIELKIKAHREALHSFMLQSNAIETRIENLRKGERGADWLHRKIRSLKTRGSDCPEAIVQRILEMIRSGSAMVSREREATRDEIAALEVAQGQRLKRPHYIVEPLGELRGFQALLPDNDLRKLLIEQVAEQLNVFKKLNLDTLTRSELILWRKWSASVEGALEKATRAVALGRTLLTVENLNPLRRTLQKGQGTELFSRYLDSLKN